MSNRKSSAVYLVVDPGASLTKAIYRLGRRGNPKYIDMRSSLQRAINGEAGMNLSFGDEQWIIGSNASENRQENLNLLKAEVLLPKVLGVLGKIAKEEQLKDISLRLGILLPYGEMADAEFVKGKIEKSAGKVTYEGLVFQHCLSVPPIISPETKGIWSILPKEDKEQSIGILMAGYRNASYCQYENGVLNTRLTKTSYHGFSKAVETIVANSSGLSPELVLGGLKTSEEKDNHAGRIISTGRYRSSIVPEEIKTVSQSQDTEFKALKIRELKNAIEIGLETYRRDVKSWLDQSIDPESRPTKLVLCGGSSNFLTEVRFSVSRTCNITAKIADLMNTIEFKDQERQNFISANLPIRLLDAWGLYLALW